jgi:hypothetical protein
MVAEVRELFVDVLADVRAVDEPDGKGSAAAEAAYVVRGAPGGKSLPSRFRRGRLFTHLLLRDYERIPGDTANTLRYRSWPPYYSV